MKSLLLRYAVTLLLGGVTLFNPTLAITAVGQAAPAAQATPVPSIRQIGTVKSIAGNSLTIAGDAGTEQTAVTVPEGARIVQLAPGSTDLKAAQTIALSDISVGDRVLVTGRPGSTTGAVTALRVILMKSGDLVQKHAAEQADWQKRGMGGIVSTVDPATGSLTLAAGARKLQVTTSSSTIFRRYAVDSIKFEDAKPGTVQQIRPGDQLEVRGAKSDDGASIKAEEVVSGTFRNLSGTLASVSPSAGTLTLRDLTTKKMMTVAITANSDIRKLPPEVAARFAARERGTAARTTSTGTTGTTSTMGTTSTLGAGAPSSTRPNAGARPAADATHTASADQEGKAPGSNVSGGAGQSASTDLSKMLARLPSAPLADLHAGDAVMIVASESASQAGADAVTAVTLLSGVEAILAATPAGAQGMTLSPWSIGGGAPEGGGGQQ